MKRVSIFILSLILSVSLTHAQKMRISGKVIDGSTNTPAEFANVVLQTLDSAFVTGVSTDMKGQFQLDKIQRGSYRLIVSAIGYTDQVTDLSNLSKSIDLGDLLLNEATEQLEEVMVTASNIVNQADRKIVFPNQQQLASSTNGVNLLQAMMLPRLQIDPLAKTIGISGGGEVQLCMNGVKVSSQDIVALQPADIIRIEYIENPSLRYGNAEAVLNYITRRHETGGSVGVDLMQSPHIVFGNDQISARLTHIAA